MLVLSRHKDGQIMIGDDTIITIADIRGGKVRVGIDAPKDTPVHRAEVYAAIVREQGGVLKRDLSELNAGEGFEFCSKTFATQHYDFNYEEWVPIDHDKAARFDCQLYRRESVPFSSDGQLSIEVSPVKTISKKAN